MHHRCCREVVTLVPSIHNSLTVIGIDVIEEAAVEMADLIDDFAGHHLRSAGDIAGSKWFGHVPIKVQDAPSGKAVVREQPDQDGPAAE
jgi:hypothetical protein